MTPLTPCDNTILQCELKAYLDGQLPFLVRQRVRRHLRTCTACREELSAMEQISTELRTDGPKPLDSSLRDRILQAVATPDAQSPSVASALRPISRWRRKPLLIWAGAATAFVGWFTLYPLVHGDLVRSISSPQTAASSVSNLKQLGAAPMMYSQYYDGATVSAARSVPAASKAAGATLVTVVPPSLPKQTLAGVLGGGGVAAPSGKLPQGVSSRLSGSSQAANSTTAIAGIPVGGGTPTIHRFNERAAAKAVNSPRDRSRMSLDLKASEDADAVERQVHREATMSVQVDNVEAKSETATQITQTAGGYVGSNELTTGEDNTKTALLTLKVPVAQFETVLSQVARLGEVKAKNVTGEDLTEQVSDQAQAEHVLRQDIGTTQEELTHRLSLSAREERMDTVRELRTRIAQAQARLKLLRKLGALSTITLELSEKPRATPTPQTGGFMNDMNDTLHGAARSMMQAARLPILTFIWILAYSPLWILLLMGYRYAVRR
jgi:anti-sigma factor RsiW